jgi:hypothetical protein
VLNHARREMQQTKALEAVTCYPATMFRPSCIKWATYICIDVHQRRPLTYFGPKSVISGLVDEGSSCGTTHRYRSLPNIRYRALCGTFFLLLLRSGRHHPRDATRQSRISPPVTYLTREPYYSHGKPGEAVQHRKAPVVDRFDFDLIILRWSLAAAEGWWD